MIRAVLDMNVLVSALISGDGAPAALVRAWLQGSFELVVSERILTELREVLDRPKLRRSVLGDEADAFTGMLRARAIVEDAGRAGVSSDPADDHVIALAQSAASVLVTGDDQMLRMRIPDLPIVTPRAFLDALKG